MSERTDAALTCLRGIVALGYGTIDSYEDPCCFYCCAEARGRATKHRENCLFVRARRIARTNGGPNV